MSSRVFALHSSRPTQNEMTHLCVATAEIIKISYVSHDKLPQLPAPPNLIGK